MVKHIYPCWPIPNCCTAFPGEGPTTTSTCRTSEPGGPFPAWRSLTLSRCSRGSVLRTKSLPERMCSCWREARSLRPNDRSSIRSSKKCHPGKKQIIFLSGPSPASYSFIFVLFHRNKNKQYTFLQLINVKNVHTIYSAGIRTHNLQIVSHIL